MSAVPHHERLTVPDSLKQQLAAFRSRVWSTKMLEAFAMAVAGVLVAFLAVFIADRFIDTPQTVRFTIFFVALAIWIAVPWAFHRWIWRHRRLDQLARLLRVREPNIGDQLLSVIELADSDSEQARSRTLCAAAISQVADAAKSRDLNIAAPTTRSRTWLSLVATCGLIAAGIALFAPDAARNAWARMSSPWRDVPRYTFTTIEKLPEEVIVPHGESMPLEIKLASNSRWQPSAATIELTGLPNLVANQQSGSYRFELPAQTQSVTAMLRVGDLVQPIHIEPKMRPELVAATALVKLPDYLELNKPEERDVRSGTLSVVEGSSASVYAEASRTLQTASINEQPVEVDNAKFHSDEVAVQEPSSLELAWRDADGLAGREPFELTVEPVPDQAPAIASQDLPRQAVLLDSEQINFMALAGDDFGVKRIGISWQGIDDRRQAKPAKGEKLLSAGGPDKSSLQAPATFSATSLGIQPQPIEVRLWTEDYLPNRERVYSPPHIFYVLTPDEHAVWITEQLSKWHRASLDVRDREMQLFETNKRLHAMTPQELADAELREELRHQAAAEANNGRRLSSLSKMGENLLRQASRNPQIGVGHLDRWAEMLQTLNDISANRMPSVSDLLAKASAESQLARGDNASEGSKSNNEGQGKPGDSSQAKPTGPMAGKQRSSGGSPGKPPEEQVPSDKPPLPSISDRESSLAGPDEPKPDESDPLKKKFNGSRLSLPNTTLAGPAKAGNKQEEKPEEDEDDASTMDKALYEQEEILAEFEKISDELNTLLANLEGSTLVKRLKAASREQNQIAERIGSTVDGLFGQNAVPEKNRDLVTDLAGIEHAGSQNVSYIMDDMQSYFERRRMNQFKLVLDDMRESEVVTALRTIGDDLPKEPGMSIAQAEFWADSLDRWAEDLVDPAGSGQCPGCKTSDALPPSLILEVLQILEGEVNLREATRVAEQAKAALEAKEHEVEATKLSETQFTLRNRTKSVVEKIQALPEGDTRFPKEIALLNEVSSVMKEAQLMLAAFETGKTAIAAETDAIELLLQCKRINPKSSGGGGSSPGGGGSGTTQDSALALLGSGLNQHEKREPREVTQATGETGRVLPEEFRAGLDEYFQRLEAKK